MPGGGFTFNSACFVGSISDRDICVKSGFLAEELWNMGDAVMADRGFTISDFLEPLGVELIIPSFLGGRAQLSEAETIRSQQIAAERIHVERIIERFKNFRIFDSRIPISMFGKINESVTICALLCNFQDPIIARQIKKGLCIYIDTELSQVQEVLLFAKLNDDELSQKKQNGHLVSQISWFYQSRVQDTLSKDHIFE